MWTNHHIICLAHCQPVLLLKNLTYPVRPWDFYHIFTCLPTYLVGHLGVHVFIQPAKNKVHTNLFHLWYVTSDSSPTLTNIVWRGYVSVSIPLVCELNFVKKVYKWTSDTVLIETLYTWSMSMVYVTYFLKHLCF